MKLFFLYIVILIPFTSYAQTGRGLPSEGREFLLGYIHPTFIDVVELSSGLKFNVYAVVSSRVDTKVDVLYFDVTGKETHTSTVSLLKENSKPILLDRLLMKQKSSTGATAEYASCLIRSKDVISVEYLSDGPIACGSYLALPVSSWGKNYVISSYNDNPGYGALPPITNFIKEVSMSSGVFLIIAGYDGTSISITPTSTTIDGHPGVNQGVGSDGTPKPYTIELNRGQCYLVRSASALTSGTDDISNTVVKANKPIGIISGHEGAATGDGSVGDAPTDERDLMVEQLIPSEFWDNTGLYTIPQIEATGNPIDGIGENYRVYVSPDSTPSTVTALSGTSVTEMYPTVYGLPPELNNRTMPISFFSSNVGSKFSVTQYELRSQVVNGSYTAPDMCQIIPRSQWKHSYVWSAYLFGGANHAYQNRYVTFVSTQGLDDILVSKSGGSFAPAQNSLTPVVKTWNNMVSAMTCRVVPGTHYEVYSEHPFMLYHFGGREWDDAADYGGQIEQDDFFGSDAHPGGMMLFNKSRTNLLNITVDTLCTGWNICVIDGHVDGGIRYVSLINDPKGDNFNGKHYQYENCSLPETLDRYALGEFSLPGNNPSLCFSVTINDPSKDSYAPIAIYDKDGNYKVIELSMKPKAIDVSPKEIKGLFSQTAVSKSVCRSFIIKNLSSNTEPMNVESVMTGSSYFRVESVVPPIPVSLKPGDSLVTTVCFLSSDEVNHIDRLTVKAGCNTLQLPLEAQALTPVIAAKDLIFGTIENGITSCKDVLVRNEGPIEFSITGLILQSNDRFTIDQSSTTPFPWTIAPGGSRKVRICYRSEESTIDTASIIWKSDIVAPFSPFNRENSLIIAQGQGVTSVSDLPRLTSLTVGIYPQPARDNVTVEVMLADPSPVTISFYDVLGNRVLRRAIEMTGQGTNKYRFNTRELPTGTYTIVIRSGSESAIKKIVVE